MASRLIAEDDNTVREFITRALVHGGRDVSAVNDGAEALAALAEGSYELLLSDIVMPVMDGIAPALKAAKE